jgi:hypothetical protein
VQRRADRVRRTPEEDQHLPGAAGAIQVLDQGVHLTREAAGADDHEAAAAHYVPFLPYLTSRVSRHLLCLACPSFICLALTGRRAPASDRRV